MSADIFYIERNGYFLNESGLAVPALGSSALILVIGTLVNRPDAQEQAKKLDGCIGPDEAMVRLPLVVFDAAAVQYQAEKPSRIIVIGNQ
jgi:hypothetical protein